MSDYSLKLNAISEKEKKLHAKKLELTQKRKIEIGDLAERCNILLASDELLAGMFLELEQAIKGKTDSLKRWQDQGARFLKPRKHKREA